MASSSASTTQSVGFPEASTLKRRSNDVGWDYGILVDAKNLDRVKCLLCGKVLSGGVYRIKEHIAHIQGNVAPCSKATKDDQLKCRNAINEAKMRRKNKKVNDDNLRAEVNINARSEPIDVEELQGSLESRVKEYICRWAYEADIPFHAFERDSFKMMLEAIGQFGPGVELPSRYEMSETFLKKEVDKVRESLKIHEEEWKLNGCSIMTDAWTDRKRRSVMNLCVNSSLGTVFLSSKECSLDSHTSEYIYEFVEHGIQQVGAENVVQVVTDNASNNMGASKLLKEKRPTIFWTSCATHTINLMLQSIASLPRYKRNRLESSRLNNLVFVQFNASLMNKNKQGKNIERLVGSESSLAQDWIVENVENDEIEPGLDSNNDSMGVDVALQPRRSARLRDLDEDSFESEGESEEEINEVEFEDDGQRIIEQYGEDEEISNGPIES